MCRPDILASNPHADRHGNSAVWLFPESTSTSGATSPAPAIAATSRLSQWRKTKDAAERNQLAAQVQQMLQQMPPLRQVLRIGR